MYCEKDSKVLDVVTISSEYAEHLMYYTNKVPNLKRAEWLEAYKANFKNSFNLEFSFELLFPFTIFQKVLLSLVDWEGFYATTKKLLKKEYTEEMVKQWLLKTIVSSYHESNLVFEVKEDTITLFIKIGTENLRDIMNLTGVDTLYYPLVQYSLREVSGVHFYELEHNFKDISFVMDESQTHAENPISSLLNTQFINLTYGVNELVKAKRGFDRITSESVLVNAKKKKFRSKRHYYLETVSLLLAEVDYASESIHEDLADIYISVDAMAQGLLKLEDLDSIVIRKMLENIYDKMPFTSFTVYQPEAAFDDTPAAQFKVLNTFLLRYPKAMTLFLQRLPLHENISYIINIFQQEYKRLRQLPDFHTKFVQGYMDSSAEHVLTTLRQLTREGNLSELMGGVLLRTDDEKEQVKDILMGTLTDILADHKDIEMQFEEYLQELASSIQITLKNDEVRIHLCTRGFDDTGFTIIYNLERKGTNVIFTLIDKGSKQDITADILKAQGENEITDSIIGLLQVVLVIHDYFNNPKIMQRLKTTPSRNPAVSGPKKPNTAPVKNRVGKKVIYIKSEQDKLDEARHEMERASMVRKTFSWYQRGHFRHYKSGKVVYIGEQIKGVKTDTDGTFKKGEYYIDIVD